MTDQEKYELNQRVHAEVFQYTGRAGESYVGDMHYATKVLDHFDALGCGYSLTRYAGNPSETSHYVAIWRDEWSFSATGSDKCVAICEAGLIVAAHLRNLETEKEANRLIAEAQGKESAKVEIIGERLSDKPTFDGLEVDKVSVVIKPDEN